jgi:hypothetical protein
LSANSPWQSYLISHFPFLLLISPPSCKGGVFSLLMAFLPEFRAEGQ